MKKNKLILGSIFALVGSASIITLVACNNGNQKDKHTTHTLTAHEQVDATCSAAGTEAYWQCSVCNKYFSDAAGATEIEAPVVIPQTEHSITVWKYNDTEHWHQCEWCDTTDTKATHASAGDMVVIVSNPPTKTNYFVGDTFSAEGLKVVKECYDECGYSVDVTSETTLENAPTELTEAGSITVNVKYGEETKSFTINVTEIKVDSITVKLKDGVKYFNNGLAIPKASDFTVTATYNNGTTGVLDESEYTVTYADGFSSNGGKITVKVNGVNVSAEIENYELVAVVLDRIEITTQPSNTTFRTGETVSLEGMVITAYNNDGTSAPVVDYTTDAQTSYADEGEKTITVTYNEKTITLTVTISDDDGAVESLAFAEGASYSVYAGSAFNQADVPAVYAVYTSGRKIALESEEYSLQMPSGNAVMGTKYEVTAKLTADETKTVTLPVKVLTKLNGNQYSDMAGGSTNTKSEKEYVIGEDGTITESTRVVPYVGGFSKVAEAGGDAHVTWTVASSTSAAATLTFRAANSYLKKVEGGYQMDALQVNSVADLYVNGEKVNIPDSVVLSGSPVSTTYQPPYNIYYTFTIEGLTLAQGNNQIMIVWKNSTLGQKNTWNETPSTMNIDYIEVATYGAEGTGTAADATVSSMVVYRKDFAYGDDIQAYKDTVSFLGVMSDGSRKLLTEAEVELTLTGNTTKPWFVDGMYTFTATLKADNTKTVSWSKTLEAPAPHALEAAGYSVVLLEGKVYWVLTFNYVGEEEHNAADFEMYNGSDTLTGSLVKARAVQIDVYFDVTDHAVVAEFYVHVKIKGVNYNNGENKNNGDFKETVVDGNYPVKLVHDTNQTVTLNGKIYGISYNYNMAIFTIKAA